MELYEEAGSIYRKGIDKLFGKICKSITNRPIGKSSSPVEHSTDERFWRKTSIEVFIELVQFNGIDEILFPDGSFTSQYYQKSNDSGVVFIDEEIITQLVEQDYGGKHYSCKDPEGYLWHFGSYNPWDLED